MGYYGIGIKVGTNPESVSRFSRRHISAIFFMGGVFFLYTAEKKLLSGLELV